KDGSSPMLLNAFHREFDNLFAGGLVQPADGSFWQLADYQGRLIASFVVAQELDPKKAAWFHKLKATARPAVDHGVTYLDSERHKLEVQHYRYRTYIKKLLNKFGPLAMASFPGQSAQQAAGHRASQAKGAVDRPRGTQARQTAKV
ncbi:MAG: hypothetical protein ACTSP0_11105, partial [Alphaproteobacteria bacterium]